MVCLLGSGRAAVRIGGLSRFGRILLGAAAGGASLAAAPLSAAPSPGSPASESWQLEAQLEPDPGPPAAQLGAAVALNGRRAAVGSRRDDDLGTDTGVVHCYDLVRKSWKQAQLLKDPAGCLTCGFGLALAMDAERLVVGAPRDGSLAFEAGRAHIFVRRGNRWALEATLARPLPGAAEMFGHSVAIHGRVMVAGAPRAKSPGGSPESWIHDAGAAEVFELQDGRWIHAATLTAPEPVTSAWFGHSLAANRDLIAVGAFGESHAGPSAGAVHLYRRSQNGWHFEQTLTPPWPGPAWFGYSLAIDGDRVLVGAPRARSPGSSASTGAAFLHERTSSGFQLAAALTAPWLASGDGLGTSVALDRESFFAGAPGDDESGDDSGALYIFTRSAGRFRPPEKVKIPEVTASDNAGATLAAANGRLIVGRAGDPESSPSPGEGTAWIYALTQAPARSTRGGAGTGTKQGSGTTAPPSGRSQRPLKAPSGGTDAQR